VSAPQIAVVGAGKMGRAVAQLAAERGWTVTAIVGREANAAGTGITRARLGDAEIVVEFTEPSCAEANVRAALDAGYAVVTGTTGWDEGLARLRERVAHEGGALLHAPNFSVGVNLLLAILRQAGRVMAGARDFEAHLVETHHAAKKDAPSGTALAMRRALREGLGADVPVTSVRTGHVPGTHELTFDGPFEQITLAHLARDRRVFADGALTAAEWLRGRQGVFTMADVLGLPGGSHP
jgi:4-hydroxy-tetrahydrodipicolinate reductase